MQEKLKVQGRELGEEEIQFISGFIRENPDWSRRRLSQELCKAWGWYNAKGQMKDMAARSMMLKLDALGRISLPPRRCEPVNRMLQRKIPRIKHSTTAISCVLHELQPLEIIITRGGHADDDLFAHLLSEYHYLGFKGVVGENMRYIIRDRKGRLIACILFGSSAWMVHSRDKYIGWSDEARQDKLHFTTNNMRFLILPWVRVPHLASHILALISRRISRDWTERYGHPIYLLETFVERDRFAGTCYRAANWIYVGATTGRSRNGIGSKDHVPIKDVYLYPTVSNFLDRLS
jgi:hypothetical protein